MRLFKRKENSEKRQLKDIPELPELPRLPSLPGEPEFGTTLPQLPNYSINSLNDKFSQNTVKNAISGKKEEMLEADEFVREQMMPEHLEIKKPSNKLEFPYKMERAPKDFELRNWQEPKTKKTGQVFIKIDKFEESLKIFELTKNKITEMEKMLEDIKELKEKEEKELSYWMAEIQTIKNQTEQVEKDIFSKLE
ncbi:hypothetical protein HYS72_01975 [Candidatus Pacearchaeota archaeon]|nr:hypothetical protein [Candidatus Pacearchaeota archaeon]MBI2057003.1 hypothetical protein [Candidatus Pacearchaeota archaeon]